MKQSADTLASFADTSDDMIQLADNYLSHHQEWRSYLDSRMPGGPWL